ncbi:predicted protein [Histoplasma mississippiense (nom. inval.)]|uniref:predicted protein n=1 Tax=Ajellomyces capsulatus (strain NAm1 / WU24) TaxID=2059318 RepID=UPI000157BE97|nr:predicted protein [Histoplasma mississippiense (nom. inval.)]EDN06932.1 predicted protein [Histoplasma mississippiense (nom. inval.)]
MANPVKLIRVSPSSPRIYICIYSTVRISIEEEGGGEGKGKGDRNALYVFKG